MKRYSKDKEERMERIVALSEKGYSLKYAAKILGIRHRTLYMFLKNRKANQLLACFRNSGFQTEKIKEMLAMRKQGHSFPSIAKHFGCDHTTVMYHCKKHGVFLERKSIPAKEERTVQRRTVDSSKHCTHCELLLTSKYFCEKCEHLKTCF